MWNFAFMPTDNVQHRKEIVQSIMAAFYACLYLHNSPFTSELLL